MSLRRAINEVLHPEKIEEGEEAFAFFQYWVFCVSAHNV